jgi:hypothetical protein
MAFMKLSSLLKRAFGHFAAGIGIGLAGGKKTIAPTAAGIAVKEIQDPHPKEDRKLWILKSVTDWLEWTGGTILGSLIRKKVKK